MIAVVNAFGPSAVAINGCIQSEAMHHMENISPNQLPPEFRDCGASKICTTHNKRIDRDSLIGKAVATSKPAISAC